MTALVIGLIAAGLITWLAVTDRRTRLGEVGTSMRVAERSTLAAVPPNTLVKLTGVVGRSERTLVAPISGRECVYYVVLVQEYFAHGELKEWHTALTQTDHVRFTIDDGSGTATVDPLGADVVLSFDHTAKESGPGAAALLAKYTAQLTRDCPRQLVEAVITVGETIAIAGMANKVGGETYFASNSAFRLSITDERALAT